MWFTENPWPPMLIATIAALVCLGIWNNERRNLYFILGMIFLGTTGGIYAVERVIVTEGEQLQQNVRQLCDQFRKRDPAALEHFSDSATELKELCRSAMELVQIHEDLRVSAFETTITNHNSRASVHFRANGTISSSGMTAYHPFRCVLTFQKEAGVWKIIDVERLDPINGESMPIMEHR